MDVHDNQDVADPFRPEQIPSAGRKFTEVSEASCYNRLLNPAGI